jgi:hypothetical protein
MASLAAFAACVASIGCKRDNTDDILAAASQTPDRLEPGEPLVGTPRVLGLDVPDGLRVVAHYDKSVHLSGPLPLSAAVDAIQRQLEPTLLELTPKRAFWERVVAKGDTNKRLLRIEITRDGPTTRVHLSEVTAPKPTHGLSDEERWERAGRNPDGTLKNPSQLL